MSNSRKINSTLPLVLILSLVRIVFDNSDKMIYIVYIINVVASLYVILQILFDSYYEVETHKNNGSTNKLFKRKNNYVKNQFVFFFCIIIFFYILLFVGLIFFSTEQICGIVNDVIGIVSVGISIEDEKIKYYLKNIYI